MDILSIVLGASTALGAGGTVGYLRQVRKKEDKDDRKDEIEKRVAVTIAPVQADISGLHSKIDHMREHSNAQLKAALYEALEPLKNQITELSTKVEPLWKALVDSALHNAEILHHPEPERAELDGLLDRFRDNVLTQEEELRLRRFLAQIKNWEGQDLGFPVYEREPSAAANLLSMLDLVRIYRERGRR